MDIESHESAMLLKESSPRRRQGLALKLAVVLCGLGLLVNLNGPVNTNIGVTFSSNKEEKKAGVSPTSRPASTMSMDWRAAAVAAPAWSVEDNDTTRTPFGVACRGGGFRQMTNWFFTNVYGPLAASQAAGAAPIIKAWLAGEELPATFP